MIINKSNQPLFIFLDPFYKGGLGEGEAGCSVSIRRRRVSDV